jgi:hypothetical protein
MTRTLEPNGIGIHRRISQSTSELAQAGVTHAGHAQT